MPECFELTEVRRQADDPAFIRLLDGVRHGGQLDAEALALLAKANANHLDTYVRPL